MIEPMLKGAEDLVSRARHSWLVTQLSEGRMHARPMGRGLPSPSEAWTLCFLADGRSEKISDVRAQPQIRLIFESTEDAFGTFAGPAVVISDAETVERRWQPIFARNFPTATDRIHAVFIDVRIEEMRLWIRGLTPEPFGVASVTLQRSSHGKWREQGSIAG